MMGFNIVINIELSNVMRGQIVSLSITCKINQAASKNMQNFIYFSSTKANYKTPANFMNFFEET